MRTKIIRIGNSQGIRIPKSLLAQSGIGGYAQLEIRDDEIVIRSFKEPRAGWAASFQMMATACDDTLLDPDTFEL